MWVRVRGGPFQAAAGQAGAACVQRVAGCTLPPVPPEPSPGLSLSALADWPLQEKKLPPIYRGKWARASQEEVAAELAKGTPHCYRFRVPPGQVVKIKDVVRGEVTWNTDTLGDFVLLRSNGLPVYNFCVAVDDALMRISHVIRAEEHLPNTLRQVGGAKGAGREACGAASRRTVACRVRSSQQMCGGSTSWSMGADGPLVWPRTAHAFGRGCCVLPRAGADLPGAGLPHPRLRPRLPHPGLRQVQAVQAARRHQRGRVPGGGLPGGGERERGDG